MKNKITKILLIVGVVIVLSAFTFNLFKNIAYPLFWSDESSTVIFGKMVLEYGYPKVSDEKNSLNSANNLLSNLTRRDKGDVYIGEGWIQYYVAAIGEYFASKTDNIYTKTALIRIPFAIIGFLAIIIFGLTVSSFFKDNKKKAFIIFFLFELVSISLVLHMREARYYSILLLFSSILINVYIRYNILKTLSYKYYIWMVPLFIVLLFGTHYPIAIAFIVTFGLMSLISSYKEYGKNILVFIHNFIKSIYPLLISLIFIVPYIIYFRIITIANAMSIHSSLSVQSFIYNISLVFYFFTRYEFLYLAIFLNIIIIILLCFKKYVATKEDLIFIKTSNFLLLFSGVYILLISNTMYVFQRYIIVLQPILIFIILFSVLLCWRIFNQTFKLEADHKRIIRNVFIWIILIAIYMNITPRVEVIKGHLYELTHQYKGPLDYAIPYIKEKYKDPSKIIIATNYEENSYMYYLDSKTIIGYLGNKLEEDSKLEPDVIIIRKFFWGGQQNYFNIFETFFKNKEYQEVKLPIYDYPFNNIPEFDFSASHLFETKMASDDTEKLYLYFKK